MPLLLLDFGAEEPGRAAVDALACAEEAEEAEETEETEGIDRGSNRGAARPVDEAAGRDFALVESVDVADLLDA